MDVTITQLDGTVIHMAGAVDDIIAVLRTFLGYENAPNTLPPKISEAFDKILTDSRLGNWSAFTRNGGTTIHRAGCSCEREGRIFHTKLGVSIADFAQILRDDAAPGLIGTAGCAR